VAPRSITLASRGAALGLALLCCGCLEPVDAPLRLSARQAAQAQSWSLQGQFGGPAQPSVASSDPWQQRFEPGGFLRVSGLCATDNRVYICDLGISRVQVFDFEGRFVESFGRGMPLKGTMLSDQEFWTDYKADARAKGLWQAQGGLPWVADDRELFQAADILVLEEGYWLADQAKTKLYRAARNPSLTWYPWSGPSRHIPAAALCWPGYVAGEGNMVAASEPLANFVRLFNSTPATDGQSKVIGKINQDLSRFVETLVTLGSHPRFREILDRQSGAGSAPGELRYPGGIAMRFGKLVVCDRGNQRLQVFEARNDDAFYWGKLIKVVLQLGTDGLKRFEEPLDVEICADGTILVLDVGRHEVAVLSPSFDRLGSFGHGDLDDPYALDASDDGRHCFVSDRSGNKVWHYVRAD